MKNYKLYYLTTFIALFFVVVLFALVLPHQKPPELVSLPTLTITPTPTWQTYRNEKYGFEFNYPPTWTIYKNANNDMLKLPYVHQFSHDNQTVTDGNGCALQYGYGGSEIPLEDMRVTKITIGGLIFTQKIWYQNNAPVFKAFSNDRQDLLVWISPGEENQCEMFIDQILSTFKFTK